MTFFHGLSGPMKWMALIPEPNRSYAGAYLYAYSHVPGHMRDWKMTTYVYAAVGVVLYTKLSRCQSEPLHSLSKPWSPPSQLPLVFCNSMSSRNLSSPGVTTRTPELKISGHPTSGTAANSWGIANRWDSGCRGRTSASRNINLEY